MNITDLYRRNIAKEKLQDMILWFVYNTTRYNQLLFTGGTCLRKVYGLNRLSEDVDFDIPKHVVVDTRRFADDAKRYLLSLDQFKSIETKLSGNGQTVFIRFPEHLFIRCDFTSTPYAVYQTERNIITADNKQFFVLSYDLPTLWTNKIIAFLTRSFFKGKFQTIPFKGRDVYDLYWFLQLSARTGYALKPNTEQLLARTGAQSLADIAGNVQEKIRLIDPKFVSEDLSPLVESKELLDRFLLDFRTSILRQIVYVLSP